MWQARALAEPRKPGLLSVLIRVVMQEENDLGSNRNPRPTRAVVLHVDDLGMCHGTNRAFLELAAAGYVTCGSVMVPCPWFLEIAEAGATDPDLDLGVHLTLTSEWEHYRWAPLSTRSPASGLVDADGYFWRDVRSLAKHVVVEAAEEELHTQIEWGVAAGLRPTHIDAHMGAAMLPQMLDIHIRLALHYRLFPVLPRRLSFAPDPSRYSDTIAALDAWGLPVVDHIRGTLAVAESEAEQGYQQVISHLPPGLTHFALHCTAPGDFEAISPQHAPWRVNEYRILKSGAVSRWCEANDVSLIGTRHFQEEWQHRAKLLKQPR
jgi:predicted glycoside hydrolase/deacetylase ChbG (UPF0249 family)